MLATALSMGPPLHRTRTIRPSRSWRWVIAKRTHLRKVPLTTWSELPQLLRRHGVSRGRFSLWPHTAGRLLRFPPRLPPFLISQASRTQAHWRWFAWLWTTRGPCRRLEWHSEPHPARLPHWQRGSGCWLGGHNFFPSAQVSFG